MDQTGNLTVPQMRVVKKGPSFYVTWRLIIVFTTSLHLSVLGQTDLFHAIPSQSFKIIVKVFFPIYLKSVTSSKDLQPIFML
jgi:hypothetical protein